MLRTFLVIGIVAIIAMLYLNFSNRAIETIYPPDEMSISNSKLSGESDSQIASGSGEVRKQPVIAETKLADGWKEIVVEKPYLKFDIPEGWYYGFEYFQEFELEGKKYYHLNGVLNNGSGKNISIIVNFQGGWCEGPENVEPIRLPEKYGLPARNYKCGSDIYVYGDMEKPGSVIPNLFISTKNTGDSEVERILSSLEHKP